jgi:hypothetical protein
MKGETQMKKRNHVRLPGYLIDHARRSLENRIVFCVDCEANRLLTVSSSANLICSSCGSKNWMHRSTPLVAHFKEYNEQNAQEGLEIDRYLNGLEKEIFFSPTHGAI